MSDLQISLLAIGAVVVAGIYAFNRWQERNFKRRAEEAFGAGRDDVLLKEAVPAGGGRIEPSLGGGEVAAIETAPVEAVADHAAEESWEEPAFELEVPAHLQEEGAPPPSGEFDPAIEFTARMALPQALDGAAMADLMQELAALGKPVRWLGCVRASGAWETLVPQRSAAYQELAVAMQLADRNGPANEAQLAAFCGALQAFAARQSTAVDCPDQAAALRTAAELDQFCLEVDVLIGLNVVAQNGASFPATKIRSFAEAAGMTLEADGTFHYADEPGAALFTLGNRESAPFTPEGIKNLSTRGVTLLFDVPRAAGGLRVFEQMTGLGHNLAGALGGMLVDDNNRPLSDAGIDKIRQQLADIYQKMEARQISAGSPRALRLFS